MATTDNNSKTPVISKKWLYSSLAIIALVLGLFLDRDVAAAESHPVDNSVEQVEINNEDGNVKIDTNIANDMTNDDFEINDLENDDFESYEDDFTEDDMED